MRTTVTLDNDVFEAAQAMARASGKRLGEVLSQLARRGLRAPAETGRCIGFPVFKVPPNAAVIPSSRAGDLLANDAP
ncbi:MAG: antitoxin [Verrucomicrobiae bacterium]|nr:antitoxin [Verrucomicrobiae bacterium]